MENLENRENIRLFRLYEAQNNDSTMGRYLEKLKAFRQKQTEVFEPSQREDIPRKPPFFMNSRYVKIANLQNNSQGESVSKGMLLTDEDRALLLKVSNLLEELLETFEILEDEEAMKSIKEAEEDVKAGRVRDYDEFLKELKKSGEI